MGKRARIWTGTEYVEVIGAQGPAGPLLSRTTATHTTASLADDASGTGTVTMAPGYRLLTVQADRACRVRLYDTSSHLAADASRAVGTDPADGTGVMLDYVFTAAGTVTLSPLVDGFTGDATSAVPVAVQNLSGATAAVALTFTYVPTEA